MRPARAFLCRIGVRHGLGYEDRAWTTELNVQQRLHEDVVQQRLHEDVVNVQRLHEYVGNVQRLHEDVRLHV